jgi:hypothetical protein
MSEKQKFFSLLAAVCDKLPRYAVEQTINADYGAEYGAAAAKRLYNVKQGKVVCLPDLVALVRHSLPQFEIPAELLPTSEEQQLAAA